MAPVTVKQYHTHDVVLSSDADHENPFMVELSATLEHESGICIEQVPGFYDGDGRWVVRFSPTMAGTWSGRTSSADAALDNVPLDDIACVANDNPRVHGILGIDDTRARKLAWSDGTPCVALGFECDWLFAYHQRDAARCEQHIDLILERGFNYVVTNVYAHTGFATPDPNSKDTRPVHEEYVYVPPDHYVFGGDNDNPDHGMMNPAFFADFDAMMRLLHERGIVAHLMIQVQNKHVHWPKRRSAEDDLFWRYVVSRYQAFGNVVWDLSKESYNLVDEDGGYDYLLERIESVRRCDAYGHLVTAHDVVRGSNGFDSPVDDACDFSSDQIHLGDTGRYNREAAERLRKYPKPYMNIEYGYELGVEDLKTYTGWTTGEWDKILLWTWSIYAAGAYPCYYYNNTSWDLITFEPEPPGWKRYQYLREFLSDVPFNDMASHNDLVSTGMCLADPGRAYMVLLPDGGEFELDLPADIEAGALTCTWMGLHDGVRGSSTAERKGFSTRLPNPLNDPAAPCVALVSLAGAPSA